MSRNLDGAGRPFKPLFEGQLEEWESPYHISRCPYCGDDLWWDREEGIGHCLPCGWNTEQQF